MMAKIFMIVLDVQFYIFRVKSLVFFGNLLYLQISFLSRNQINIHLNVFIVCAPGVFWQFSCLQVSSFFGPGDVNYVSDIERKELR